MFNKEFFPTPRDLIHKMLQGIDFNLINSVLEPSAGKGDIADVVKEKIEVGSYYRKIKADIDVIEIDENLRAILKEKEYRLVESDFLNFHTFKRYDLIIMNPPFSNGDAHLLKALEIQKNGGAIVCLLNAETIRCPFSNQRKVLVKKLDELEAKIEYIENAFSKAENKTDVEIALIKIFISPKEKASYIFEELEKSNRVNEKQYHNDFQVAKDDYIDEIVNQYNLEVETGIKLIEEYNAIVPHMLREFRDDGYHNSPILKLTFGDSNRYSVEDLTINNFIRYVRYKYWKALFDSPKFTEKLTQNLIAELHNKIEELKDYDFSFHNIYTLKIDMSKNLIAGVEDTILDLFEELSNKYHWQDETSKNIHYFNGWKTNKSYFINKKVIIPYMDAFNNWDKKFEPHYTVTQKLSDIEKSLNYLDGNRTMNIDLCDTLNKAKEDNKTTKIELKYFNVTFYKKGTCHLEFTNLELLKKLNIYGCQKKNWLPPSYCNKIYDDMDIEEQTIIDEFEGKKSYEKTFEQKNYYIVNKSELLLLTNN